MAEKNIQMRKKNSNGTFDDYFPITKVGNVIGGSEIVKGELSWSASKNVAKTVYLGFRPKYVFVIITLGTKTQTPAIVGQIIDGAISRVPGDNYSGELYKLLITSTGFSITPLVVGEIDVYCSYIAIK